MGSARVVAVTSARAFALVARLRRARALHPKGLVVDGTLRLTGAGTGVPFFDRVAALPAVARLSKAGGTPGAVPDALGLALRVPDAEGPGRPLDLLLVTVGPVGPTRSLPLPTWRWQSRYSAVLPHDVAGHRALFTASVLAPQRSVRPSLAALARALDEQPLVFALRLLQHEGGPQEGLTVATLELPGPARGDGPAPRFDPTNVVAGLGPPRPLAGLRRTSYAGSRAGWHH